MFKIDAMSASFAVSFSDCRGKDAPLDAKALVELADIDSWEAVAAFVSTYGRALCETTPRDFLGGLCTFQGGSEVFSFGGFNDFLSLKGAPAYLGNPDTFEIPAKVRNVAVVNLEGLAHVQAAARVVLELAVYGDKGGALPECFDVEICEGEARVRFASKYLRFIESPSISRKGFFPEAFIPNKQAAQYDTEGGESTNFYKLTVLEANLEEAARALSRSLVCFTLQRFDSPERLEYPIAGDSDFLKPGYIYSPRRGFIKRSGLSRPWFVEIAALINKAILGGRYYACEQCGKTHYSTRKDTKLCGNSCRVAKSTAKKRA